MGLTGAISCSQKSTGEPAKYEFGAVFVKLIFAFTLKFLKLLHMKPLHLPYCRLQLAQRQHGHQYCSSADYVFLQDTQNPTTSSFSAVHACLEESVRQVASSADCVLPIILQSHKFSHVKTISTGLPVLKSRLRYLQELTYSARGKQSTLARNLRHRPALEMLEMLKMLCTAVQGVRLLHLCNARFGQSITACSYGVDIKFSSFTSLDAQNSNVPSAIVQGPLVRPHSKCKEGADLLRFK